MKKSLVALAVLGSFAGFASAATSVTLYGQIEVGYQDLTGKGNFDLGATPTSKSEALAQEKFNSKVSQYPRRTDRIGVKGEEDLGNGLAATFQLEGNIAGDVGTANLFNRESTVGLKGAFGHVRVGRSRSQMDMALGGLTGVHGVTDVDLYSISLSRHSNGLFYDYSNSGFNFGADVTTKGGSVDNTNEGATGSKVAYGARLGYYGNGLLARVAYQNDGDDAKGRAQHETGGVIAYNFNELYKVPVLVGVSYAQGKGLAKGFFAATGLSDADKVYADKASVLSGIVRGWFSPNDSAYVLFQKRKSSINGATINNAWATGLGYEHKLSKRTAVFVDTVYLKSKNAAGMKADGKVYGYSFGLAHSF